MDLSLLMVFLLATVVVWGGGFFLVRAAMRKAKRSFTEFPPYAPPADQDGYTVEFRSCHVAAGQQGENRSPWVEYTIGLRGSLAELGLVDGDALQLRREKVVPALDLTPIGSPETGDDVFDGVFEMTREPTAGVRAALAEPRVRELLTQLRDAYRGLYVENGLVRVAEAGKPDAETRETNTEALVAIASQLAEF